MRPTRGGWVSLMVALLVVMGIAREAAAATPVEVVLGKGPRVSLAARLQAARTLGQSLPAQEIEALYGFLERHQPDDPGQPGDLVAIKNDVVNVLRSQRVVPPGLATHLMAMFRDRTHEDVWRDYCLQHLGALHVALPPAGQEQVVALLWEAADEKTGMIPGTALIALSNVAGQAGADRGRVATKALEMVRAPEYGEPARITALQICAMLQAKSVLPEARSLAVNGSIPVRSSAMACLGVLGDESDLDLLKQAAGSTDVRLRTSAQAAVAKRMVR
jgi:hypothetical protein